MRRVSAAFLAALIAVGVLAPASFAASPAASASVAVPRVVLIVGPSGSATSRYRSQARAAAAIARRYTPDVVELYSPDATWPAVRQAVAGASLVVYMGHGNGWPSPYHDALFPATENGFGLNPTAGGGDAAHQYFGETAVGSQLKFAKNAVVLLNHLCYASGLSEPGLPEGTLDVAKQRVDNFAAGFVRAGAAAVIADAYASPSYLVRAILAGRGSIQSAWQKSPEANGNRIAFQSVRSPGYVAQMDPETASSGYTRSIVMKAGLAPADVLAGASGSVPPAVPVIPPVPSLIATGLKLAVPDFAVLPAAGTSGSIDVPFTIKDPKALPKGLQASVRWDPIDVAVAPADPSASGGGADPATSAPPATDPTPTPSPAPTPSTTEVQRGNPFAAVKPGDAATLGTPLAGKPKIDPPADGIDLVVPEQVGDVVAPKAVTVGKSALDLSVTLPTVPGRYRLTITLHDADGVAYDAETQAMVRSVIVRVTGDFDGAIQAASTAELTAGTEVSLGVRVINLGSAPWGHGPLTTPNDQMQEVAADPATVVGRWIPLSDGAALPTDGATQIASTDLPVELQPGASVEASLDLRVPDASGTYLLVLDVVTPERGSLAASGADPTLVRVTVTPAP